MTTTDAPVTVEQAAKAFYEAVREANPIWGMGAEPKVRAASTVLLAALASAPAEQTWRCFHCGDVFTDDRCARLHFGRDEDSEPACIIKAGAEQGLLRALREAEYAAADARQAIADESTDAAKAYYAQANRHAAALRNAEEAGYERGLADGRSLASAPAGDEVERWHAERPIAASYDNRRQYAVAVMAWEKRKPAALARPRAAVGGEEA